MDDNSKDLSKPDKDQKLNLTDKNWAMLKHIEQGKSIKDAYYSAGYQGTDPNTPYEIYSRLKKKLEAVYEADNIDSLRLKMAAKRILDMPIEDRPVKPETHLKAIETLAKLTDHKKADSKIISPFIVFKDSKDNIKVTQGQLIDAEPIESDSTSTNED